MITAEQAEQARGIVINCIEEHHNGNLPYRQVWTKAAEDFDGAPFLSVWVIYDGEPGSIDIPKITSFPSYLMMTMREAGIYAIPSVSYVPVSEVDQIGTPWIG